jgi:hypothetical protein
LRLLHSLHRQRFTCNNITPTHTHGASAVVARQAGLQPNLDSIERAPGAPHKRGSNRAVRSAAATPRRHHVLHTHQLMARPPACRLHHSWQLHGAGVPARQHRQRSQLSGTHRRRDTRLPTLPVVIGLRKQLYGRPNAAVLCEQHSTTHSHSIVHVD